jgi:hypothetical protein
MGGATPRFTTSDGHPADVSSTLVEILGTLKVHGEAFVTLTSSVQRVDEAIRGNGKPGLRHEVDILNRNLAECQRRAATRDEMEARRKADSDKWWTRFVQPGIVLIWAAAAMLLLGGVVSWMEQKSRVDVRDEVRSALEALVPPGVKEP